MKKIVLTILMCAPLIAMEGNEELVRAKREPHVEDALNFVEQRATKRLALALTHERQDSPQGGIEEKRFHDSAEGGSKDSQHASAETALQEKRFGSIYHRTLSLMLKDSIYLARALFEGVIDLKRKDPKNNQTLLHKVVIGGSINCLRLLLEEFKKRGLSIDEKDIGGYTPLAVAVWKNKKECAEALLAAGSDLTDKSAEENETLLHLAAHDGSIDCLRLLLEEFKKRGFSLDGQASNGATPLSLAVSKDKKDCVETLLAAGADLRWKDPKTNKTLLHGAALYGSINCLQLLIEEFKKHGLSMDEKDVHSQTPLVCAVLKDKRDCAETLLAAGADLRWKDPKANRTLLHVAALYGSINYLQLMIEEFKKHMLSIDKKDIDARTALFYAVLKDKKDCAEALLAAGADIRWRDPKTNRTLLHIAAQSGSINCLKLLIGRGLPMEERDGNAQTPIMLAERNGHKTCVDELAKARHEIFRKSQEAHAERAASSPSLQRRPVSVAVHIVGSEISEERRKLAALSQAASLNQGAQVQLLFNGYADKRQASDEIVSVAARCGHFDLVRRYYSFTSKVCEAKSRADRGREFAVGIRMVAFPDEFYEAVKIEAQFNLSCDQIWHVCELLKQDSIDFYYMTLLIGDRFVHTTYATTWFERCAQTILERKTYEQIKECYLKSCELKIPFFERVLYRAHELSLLPTTTGGLQLLNADDLILVGTQLTQKIQELKEASKRKKK